MQAKVFLLCYGLRKYHGLIDGLNILGCHTMVVFSALFGYEMEYFRRELSKYYFWMERRTGRLCQYIFPWLVGASYVGLPWFGNFLTMNSPKTTLIVQRGVILLEGRAMNFTPQFPPREYSLSLLL